MESKRFVEAMAGGLPPAPLAAGAQPIPKLPRVALVCEARCEDLPTDEKGCAERVLALWVRACMETAAWFRDIEGLVPAGSK